MSDTDFEFRNEFSLVILYPISDRAKVWLDENVQIASWQSSDALAIEPRYYNDLAEGILEAGMSIKQIN